MGSDFGKITLGCESDVYGMLYSSDHCNFVMGFKTGILGRLAGGGVGILCMG